MPQLKTLLRSTVAIVAIAACAIPSLPQAVSANGLPGFTLWGGTQQQFRLFHRLDFGGRPNNWDRYRLRIPAQKLSLAVAQFTISYPAEFNAKFDTKQMEVWVGRKKIPLEEIIWDQENNTIEIFPETPVAARSNVEFIFSEVRNPTNGEYRINVSILSPGDVPQARYVGTWDIGIGR